MSAGDGAVTDSAHRRPFDLAQRTFEFARDVRTFVRRLPRTIANAEDARQRVRSSGSVGANYIEANEPLGPKDFRMRIKIARKEAKESRYWLRLLDVGSETDLSTVRDGLVAESEELLRIFSAILRKSDDSPAPA